MVIRRIMRMMTMMPVIALLSGCGCMLEPGDSRDIGDYWNGCWAEAKRTQ